MHCDPTSRDTNSSTALHLAVMNEHFNLVQANMTLFQWAKVMNHSDIAQYISTETQCNALHIYCYSHDETSQTLQISVAFQLYFYVIAVLAC